MVSIEEAMNTVLGQPFKMGGERVSLSSCAGRVLAEDIFSDMDMPPFDKSAVDGYACRMEDLQLNLSPGNAGLNTNDSHRTEALQVIETIPAGKIPSKRIGPFECVKIMTGAMVPGGADCVVMVEDSEEAGGNRVVFTRFVSAKNICFRGEDIRSGDLVLEKGTKITSAHVAVLASVGAVTPLVAKLPVVGIISTGDELVEPACIPRMAQIRNSNGWQLESQVKEVPAHPSYLGIAPDNGPELRKIIDYALANNDVVLLSGGVSMGEFDHVPGILRDAGVEILFEKVAIQPGKPTVFGRKGDKYIFGLPGNPVSSFILFEIMVRPLLLGMMGHHDPPPELVLPMGTAFSRRKSDRKTMLPVLMKNGTVFPVEYHGSAHINAFTKANGILIIEIGTTSLNKGELVHVRPL
ncbi:MAG: gephyrin-like molybdotransferase Glp [Bacteroidota bacterium]